MICLIFQFFKNILDFDNKGVMYRYAFYHRKFCWLHFVKSTITENGLNRNNQTTRKSIGFYHRHFMKTFMASNGILKTIQLELALLLLNTLYGKKQSEIIETEGEKIIKY